jgi:uncharacterized protein YrrD
MRKATELIGKAIINHGTGEQVATVRDLMFDTETRALTAMLVDESWSRDARVVPWRLVTGIGDVVLVHSDIPIIIASSEPNLVDQIMQNVRITGTPIITDAGERIGTVSDLFLNERGAVIGYEVSQGFLSSLSGHKFLPAEQVQAIGKDALIAATAELKSVSEVQQDRTEAPPHADAQPERTLKVVKKEEE